MKRSLATRTLAAGIAAGAGLAAAFALAEVVLRALVPGGVPARRLVGATPFIAGAAELPGIAVGAGAGLLAILVSRRFPARGPRLAGFLAGALGIAALVVAAILGPAGERQGRPGRVELAALALLPLIAAMAGWALERRIDTVGGDAVSRVSRVSRSWWTARWIRFRVLIAPVLALPVIVAFPRLFLGEPPGAADAAWGGSAVLVALLLAIAVLASVTPWPDSEFIDSRAARRAVIAFLALAVVGSYGAFYAVQSRAPRAGSRPNLLLVVIDTLRPDHLSCYGYARHTSPAIDRVAARGARFTEAVSAASLTMPSVATILTGRLPFEHGVRCHPAELPAAELTLAESLKREGYATGAVVSNTLLSREWGFAQGFDSYDVFGETSLGPLADLVVLRAYAVRIRNDRAGVTATRAIRWMRRHDSRPFFLWVHFIDPHFPYEPGPPFDRRFIDHEPAAYDALLAAYRADRIARGKLAADTTLAAETLAEGAALYDGEIAQVDSAVGRMVDALEGLGDHGTTITVVTADHGEALGEHGINFAHTFTTYDELVRVPLIIVAPGTTRGASRLDTQVSLVDLAPTLLDLARVRIPGTMSGRSFLPLLAGSAFTARPAYAENAPLLAGHPSYPLISSFKGMHVEGMEGKWRMVRLPPWKLVRMPGRPGGEDVVFDLATDPGELSPAGGQSPQASALEASLGVFLSDESKATAVEPAAVSPEEERRLRSLGYVH